jgi:hypothetical protein
MAKTVDNSVLDGAIAVIKTATRLCLCSAQPTTFAEATSTYMLVQKTGLTAGSFTGPVDGDVSGRKVTKTAEASITATNTGTGIYAALCTESVLLYVTTMTSQAITAANLCNAAAFKVEFTDPT